IQECFIKLKGKYEGIKVSTSGAYDYNMGEIDYSKFIKFLELFIEKLEQLAAKLQDEDEKIVSSNQSNSVTINNNNTNTANTNITQNISIKSTMEKINQIPDEILAKNLKYELKGMLGELENCKNSQEKKSKLMEVVKWLGDKSVDAFIACLPYFAGLGL
ncbi:MAG: hypothetical protein ACFNTA_04680, partial [Campylobacter sp.]|uniref:hypothetical protein n=1 Tax=Campylobacter sp. TaxID=205 RepID=UPI00361E45E3